MHIHLISKILYFVVQVFITKENWPKAFTNVSGSFVRNLIFVWYREEEFLVFTLTFKEIIYLSSVLSIPFFTTRCSRAVSFVACAVFALFCVCLAPFPLPLTEAGLICFYRLSELSSQWGPAFAGPWKQKWSWLRTNSWIVSSSSSLQMVSWRMLYARPLRPCGTKSLDQVKFGMTLSL